MKHFSSIILIIMMMTTLSAQWSQLNNSELSTVAYNGIVNTGTAVILITDGGVFRSTDNGLSWSLSTSGMDPKNTSGRSIVFLGSRNEVWITSGSSLYKSTNHGASWTPVITSGLPEFVWIEQLGLVGNRLVIMYSYHDVGLGTHSMKLAYSDNGIEWTPGVILGPSGTSWWEILAYQN